MRVLREEWRAFQCSEQGGLDLARLPHEDDHSFDFDGPPREEAR